MTGYPTHIIGLVAYLVATFSTVRIVMAQNGSPPATTPTEARTITPAEDARGLQLYGMTGLDAENGQRVPKSELDSAITRWSSLRIAVLQGNPVTGIQLDPMGKLYLSTGKDSLAKQQFEKRLATKGLSVDDRAYTLFLASSLFSHDAKNEARMRTALGYVARLDKLPAQALPLRFSAHVGMAYSYYLAGNGPEVLRHTDAAFALLPALPYAQRNGRAMGAAFLIEANVLSGGADGRARIDSIGAWLLALATPTPELLAQDSAYLWLGRGTVREVKEAVQMTGYLGRSAPAIPAHYWWNTTAPVSTSVSSKTTPPVLQSLADGVVRVLEFGSYGCSACQVALPRLDAWRKTTRERADGGRVVVLYVTYSEDFWGATRCTPDEVANHLKRYYLDRKGLRVPIALWIGPRENDPDGGTLVQNSPAFEALAIRAVPTFVVTDGKGIVRHISVGFSEPLLHGAVQYLIGEAKRNAERRGTISGEHPAASH
jgi:thiol-disulfide isomerase/thioredoxin